jgi:hypothetical protein
MIYGGVLKLLLYLIKYNKKKLVIEIYIIIELNLQINDFIQLNLHKLLRRAQ